MAVYTKTGDKGTTSLFDGMRVSKHSSRVETYGTLDELNAHISLCEKLVQYAETKELLHKIQFQLFRLCAEVATNDLSKLKAQSSLITADEIKEFENVIDKYIEALPVRRAFILSGKCQASAELHIARTVCRRAERLLIGLNEEIDLRPEVLAFTNRLSDLLYVLARMEDFIFLQDKVVEKVMRHLNANEQLIHDAKTSIETVKPSADLRERLHILIEAAMKKAKEINVPVVISIVDEHGNLVYLYRMEEALLVSLEISPSKAYTAVALKAPTHALKDVVKPGADLYAIESMVNKKIVTFGGGYPLYIDGKICGGIGISGGSVAEDMTIAEYAIACMEAKYGK